MQIAFEFPIKVSRISYRKTEQAHNFYTWYTFLARWFLEYWHLLCLLNPCNKTTPFKWKMFFFQKLNYNIIPHVYLLLRIRTHEIKAIKCEKPVETSSPIYWEVFPGKLDGRRMRVNLVQQLFLSLPIVLLHTQSSHTQPNSPAVIHTSR